VGQPLERERDHGARADAEPTDRRPERLATLLGVDRVLGGGPWIGDVGASTSGVVVSRVRRNIAW